VEDNSGDEEEASRSEGDDRVPIPVPPLIIGMLVSIEDEEVEDSETLGARGYITSGYIVI